MNKYRGIQLLAIVFWAGSIWVAYWSGYGQRLFEGDHGVYALASSGVIQDVHTLVRLNGGRIDEARTELVGSIKFKLQGMELREQAEDARPKSTLNRWLRLMADSIYETPAAASSLAKIEESTHIPSASEIRAKYRDKLTDQPLSK